MFIENPDYRNKLHIFADRNVAGLKLCEFFNEIKIDLLLAIPNGGVPVALPLVQQIHPKEFNLLIIRKIQLPTTTEAGFGAITPDGQVFLNDRLLNHLHLENKAIERQIELAREQIQEKMNEFKLKDIVATGKNVLLVDDGIASGYSMIAGINWLKQQGAKEVIVAVPTAPLRSLHIIESRVDKIICLNIREGFSFAVADAYKNWYDVPINESKEIVDQIQNLMSLNMKK